MDRQYLQGSRVLSRIDAMTGNVNLIAFAAHEHARIDHPLPVRATASRRRIIGMTKRKDREILARERFAIGSEEA